MADSRRKRSHDDANDDSDGKKSRNRESARKCREKKLKETEALKQKNTELIETNRALNSKKGELERKLQECIRVIQRHTQSGCILPQNVADIIESFQDFRAVGVQHTPRGNDIGNHSDTSMMSDRYQFDSDSEYEEPRPVMKGLFTGEEQLPAISSGKTKTRNRPSRSSSKSPPTPSALSTNRNHMARPPSSLSSSSSKNINDCTSPQWTQPSWALLHQQASNGELSPGLSPVQTVPNIDPEWDSRVPDNCLKQNGFPDIEEAVQHAQRDPGVMDDVGYNRHLLLPHHQHHQTIASPSSSGSERQSIQSFGFTPNLGTVSNGSSQNNASLVHGSNQQLSHGVSVIHDSLKPTTSSSTTVSMEHTAELLSQAIANNFDPSEVSEDLKRQYVQLAKTQNNEVTEQPHLNQGDHVPTEHDIGEVNNGVQYQTADVTQMQASLGGDNDISYESLLRLAREQENITVQYQGRDYSCNYEQVEQLLKFISGQKSGVNVSDPDPVHGHVQNFYSGPQVAHEVVATELLNQANAPSYIVSQIYTPVNNFAINDNVASSDIIVPMATQAPEPETPVQSTHLPTTVLSMIEEDSQQSQSQSTAVTYHEHYVESIDYSENVKDLPSLSLTEDHTNIFEKKRRNMQ